MQPPLFVRQVRFSLVRLSADAMSMKEIQEAVSDRGGGVRGRGEWALTLMPVTRRRTAVLHYTIAQSLREARLADWHRRARRNALARSARQPRRAHPRQPPHFATALVAVLTRRVLHRAPTASSSPGLTK